MTPARRKSASAASSAPASAAVCELAALAPARVAAALQGEHRLPAGDAPGDARELPRVAERLEVEDDEARLVLVLPVLEQVVGRDVGLVADGHERGEPQPACARRLEQSEPESAALGREADRAERKRLPGERRVDARRSHGEPEAVRPEQAGAVGANQRQQPLLALRALAAHLGEAGGQHAERPRPPLERLAGNLEHARRPARRSRPDRRAREARRSSGRRQRLRTAAPDRFTG